MIDDTSMSIEDYDKALLHAHLTKETLRQRVKDYRAVALKLLNGDKDKLAKMYQDI